MNENEQKDVVSPETVENDMAAAFAEAKKNTVPKQDYDKVVKMNQQLTQQLINNQSVEVVDKPEFDLAAECKKLNSDVESHKHITNLEYAERSIAIRNAALEKGYRDPILSTDPKSVPSEEEVAARTAVWSIMEDCVKEANGDPTLFNALMRKKAPR